MKIQNGIYVYMPGEVPELPVPIDPKAVSLYGFKLVGVGATAEWVPASEEDFRASQARRLGITPGEVNLNELCRGQGSGCDFSSCGPGRGCYVTYDPQTNYKYCGCGG